MAARKRLVYAEQLSLPENMILCSWNWLPDTLCSIWESLANTRLQELLQNEYSHSSIELIPSGPSEELISQSKEKPDRVIRIPEWKNGAMHGEASVFYREAVDAANEGVLQELISGYADKRPWSQGGARQPFTTTPTKLEQERMIRQWAWYHIELSDDEEAKFINELPENERGKYHQELSDNDEPFDATLPSEFFISHVTPLPSSYTWQSTATLDPQVRPLPPFNVDHNGNGRTDQGCSI